ncbi:MAG: Lpg1974 family pore-forming outer membrane protein [Planctomycetaceae bacterium]|nr:Lpg1974 family pore-forming outer membrane protein [Planctomycetaceae bacterium]
MGHLTPAVRTVLFAASLLLTATPTFAQEFHEVRPEPPPVPVVESPLASGESLSEILDRLQQLEDQNNRLQLRLNSLAQTQQQPIVRRQITRHVNSAGNAGVFGQVDYLRWAYRQPGLEYGISDIGGVQDRGAVGSVLGIDGEYDNGVRAVIGYRFDRSDCNCLFDRPELLFRYTQFGTELEDITIGPLRASFISSDNSENNDSDDGFNDITPDDRATSATARVTFDYDVYDIEMAQAFELSPTLTLRVSGGARAAVLNEFFSVTYAGGDFQTAYNAFRAWDYSGAGMTFGGDLNWHATKRFNVTFGARSGVLLGRYESRHFFPDDEPGVPTDVRHGETRVNPFVEVSAGVLYERPIGRSVLTVGAGYEIVNWFNMADNRTFSDSHMEGQNINSIRDLSLDGMYARIGINY